MRYRKMVNFEINVLVFFVSYGFRFSRVFLFVRLILK